jgi:hypothetical protein
VLEDSAERVGVLRRKIAALETLAMDPGTSLPESESAQTTANKLRLELSRLVRDGATLIGTGPALDVALPSQPTSPEPLRAEPPSTAGWSAADWPEVERDTEPPPPPPVVHAGPRWLRYVAPGVALSALGVALVLSSLPEPGAATRSEPSAPAATIDITPRLAAQPAPPVAQHCKDAEESVQAAAASLIGHRRSGLTLTSANVDGCSGRFESRLVAASKGRPPAKRLRAVSNELTAALCADPSIRPALVEQGASYTFAYYDQGGTWLEEATVSGANCTSRPARSRR